MTVPISPRQPRFREVNRQLRLAEVVLDDAILANHPVRDVMKLVEAMDLSGFHADIKAVHGARGRNTTPITVLLGLWVWATIDGIGSAREIYRQCQTNLVYRWILGGLTLDYHTISDFRHKDDMIERVLIDHVTALRKLGLVTFESVALDGMRVRASAGADSAHREATLERIRAEVTAHLEALKQQEGEALNAAQRRSLAAKKRHLEEKDKRLQEAVKVAQEMTEKRQERLRKHPSEAKRAEGQSDKQTAGRGSSTDPEARKIKMPDGGMRMAYNVQSVTDVDSGIIIAVAVNNQGSDGGLMTPMLEQTHDAYQEYPKNLLVDGGYADNAGVEEIAKKK